MEDLVDDLTKIPLSGEDMIEICSALGADKSKLAWITYNALQSVESVNQLFKNGEINSVFISISKYSHLLLSLLQDDSNIKERKTNNNFFISIVL